MESLIKYNIFFYNNLPTNLNNHHTTHVCVADYIKTICYFIVHFIFFRMQIYKIVLSISKKISKKIFNKKWQLFQ